VRQPHERIVILGGGFDTLGWVINQMVGELVAANPEDEGGEAQEQGENVQEREETTHGGGSGFYDLENNSALITQKLS